jgi:hypothetical protein
MKFILTIDCDGDAFTARDNPGPELCKILGTVKQDIESRPAYMMTDGHQSTVYDSNKVDVGYFSFDGMRAKAGEPEVKTFFVDKREVWVRTLRVKAENELEAREMVEECIWDDCDDVQYEHDLPTETWEVSLSKVIR